MSKRPPVARSSTRPASQWAPIMPWDSVRFSPPRESARTANWRAPSCWRSIRRRQQAISRDPGYGWQPVVLWYSWSPRSSPAPHQVGAAATRRPRARRRRDDRRDRGSACRRGGAAELRHYTSAFNTMAQVVRASLDRQRRLVADASHQLRNPLGRSPAARRQPRRAGRPNRDNRRISR